MLKLIIGNRAYSSWSMRGWLAVKQAGEGFEEILVPVFDEEWEKTRKGAEFAPGGGKVPILWDGECVVWDSLAIIDSITFSIENPDRGRLILIKTSCDTASNEGRTISA